MRYIIQFWNYPDSQLYKDKYLNTGRFLILVTNINGTKHSLRMQKEQRAVIIDKFELEKRKALNSSVKVPIKK